MKRQEAGENDPVVYGTQSKSKIWTTGVRLLIYRNGGKTAITRRAAARFPGLVISSARRRWLSRIEVTVTNRQLVCGAEGIQSVASGAPPYQSTILSN